MGSSTPTRALIDDIEHAFVGTATTCGTNPNNGSTVDGEACNMQDVLIIGFDVCDDTRASANAVFSNLKYECNVGEFIHNNGGGMKVENANVHNFIEGVLETGAPGSGVDITKAQWPIHAIASDTNGEVKITIDTSGATRDQIANGDTVIIGNFPLYSGPPGAGLSSAATRPLHPAEALSILRIPLIRAQAPLRAGRQERPRYPYLIPPTSARASISAHQPIRFRLSAVPPQASAEAPAFFRRQS